MKWHITILSLFVLLSIRPNAQQPANSKVRISGSHQRISGGPALPLARFSATHSGGLTISYIRNTGQYQNREPYQRKKTGWLTGATLSHYLGKKETIGINRFRYKNYSLFELNGGIACYPVNKLDLSFRAGPALGYYNKSLRFTFTGHLQGSYQIGPKTNITPGLALVKEPGSDALWITSLQLGLLF